MERARSRRDVHRRARREDARARGGPRGLPPPRRSTYPAPAGSRREPITVPARSLLPDGRQPRQLERQPRVGHRAPRRSQGVPVLINYWSWNNTAQLARDAEPDHLAPAPLRRRCAGAGSGMTLSCETRSSARGRHGARRAAAPAVASEAARRGKVRRVEPRADARWRRPRAQRPSSACASALVGARRGDLRADCVDHEYLDCDDMANLVWNPDVEPSSLAEAHPHAIAA